MTTTITVKANHGWPVDVHAYGPDGVPFANYGGRVAAGETQDFICHSSMDLRIHEVQPSEAETPFAFPDGLKVFKHALDAEVSLTASGESGRVVARAEYTNAADSYLVRYKAGDGRQTEAWWSEDAIAG